MIHLQAPVGEETSHKTLQPPSLRSTRVQLAAMTENTIDYAQPVIYMQYQPRSSDQDITQAFYNYQCTASIFSYIQSTSAGKSLSYLLFFGEMIKNDKSTQMSKACLLQENLIYSKIIKASLPP